MEKKCQNKNDPTILEQSKNLFDSPTLKSYQTSSIDFFINFAIYIQLLFDLCDMPCRSLWKINY